MGYVAGKRLDVKTAAGTYEVRQPGDPIPEAASWPNLDAWLHQGSIKLVPDGSEGKLVEKKTPPTIKLNHPASVAPAAKAAPKPVVRTAPEPLPMVVEDTPASDTPKKKAWKRKQ